MRTLPSRNQPLRSAVDHFADDVAAAVGRTLCWHLVGLGGGRRRGRCQRAPARAKVKAGAIQALAALPGFSGMEDMSDEGLVGAIRSVFDRMADTL